MAQHARQAQATFGCYAMGVEIAAMKIRVGENGLACDIVEGDVLRRQLGCGGDHERVS